MEKKQTKKYIQIIILSVFIVLFALSTIFNSAISKGLNNMLYIADIKASKTDLVVHFINVGQGDAIALRFPNEEVMLIDSGPKDSQNILIEYIKDNVLSGNNNLNINYVILTHPDTDHSGGMSAVFSEFDVDKFFRPNIASISENFSDFAMSSNAVEYDETIKLADKEKDLQINFIDKEYEFNIGKALVQIFPPLKVYDTTNEMSPIVKISYLGKSFLFTGDIQGDSENDMLEYYNTKLDADVLKVAHHGSDTSTSEDFVKIVTPKYAIICVGKNSYGHPHFNTITTLSEYGANVLTTKQKSIRFVCGYEMFGVLDEKDIHSFEFVEWWVIVLVIDMVLFIILGKAIIKLIKYKNNKNENV